MSEDNPSPEYLYPVLSPIKFRGTVVKPPSFVQLNEAEAAPLIADKLVGAEASLLPEPAAENDDAAPGLESPAVDAPASSNKTTAKARKTTAKAKG